MSEQDGAQSSTKQRRSRKTNIANQQNGKQATTIQRPATFDREEWKAYWKTQGQPWRTVPEISQEHQQELEKLRVIAPDIQQGIYPFKGIPLTRADIEWLLATHHKGQGPFNQSDAIGTNNEGLDLRGADLRGVDLHELPLSRIRGGLAFEERREVTQEQQRLAAILLQNVILSGAKLEGAILSAAQLKGADLSAAQLERADLSAAQLEGATLIQAQLKGATLSGAQLEGATLAGAQLEGATLVQAQLKGATLVQAQLKGAILAGAQLKGAILNRAQLEGADPFAAQLEGADFIQAQLKGAILSRAQLEGANLRGAQLENTSLNDVCLCDTSGIGPRLADVQWGNTNLAVIDWTNVKVLGDEQDARQKTTSDGKRKDKDKRLYEFRSAVRANRQLAVALQGQGLNEEASRFAYRAQKLQRVVLRLQRKWGQYLFYTFLEVLAGYGYRPIRTVLWYLGMIFLFALAYHSIGGLSLYPPDAFVYSLTSFHGRGFFPGLNARPSLHDPLVMLAAIEAVIGLFIEISFIATFTQRFFGK